MKIWVDLLALERFYAVVAVADGQELYCGASVRLAEIAWRMPGSVHGRGVNAQTAREAAARVAHGLRSRAAARNALQRSVA